MYYSKLKKNGNSKVNIPKFLYSEIKEDILKNINQKFPFQKLNSYQSLINFFRKLPDKTFKHNFGNNSSRILSDRCTSRINSWVQINIPKKINAQKASINLISKSDYKNNKYLSKNQFSAFYRIVRKLKKDVGFPHKDSSFWNIGDVRKTTFNHKIVWKLWIPIFGVNKQNTLNMIYASHRDKIKISYIKKNGQLKPKISSKYINKNSSRIKKPIKNNGSEGILFHSDTVHFAEINKTSNCRISIEFNILAK